MNFTKMQAAGNDFILVETGNIQRDWSQVAIAICNRHFGIGGDGLLLVLPSDKADFQMRLFNPDGSEAEACGNGLICLAKYVVDVGLANTGTQQILVQTMSGIRRVKLYKAKGKVVRIQVGMGEPKLGAKDIPVVIEPDEGSIVDIRLPRKIKKFPGCLELILNFVSIGNPHAVYFSQQPVSDFPLSQLGPKVEQHKIFPKGVNFEVARVISQHQIEARVWERGVGETLACGSGACAIAVVAQQHGYIDNKVNIKLPGGILDVEWDGVGEVFLSGQAEIVFSGDWPE
ncbi:diaminopimelate epimerase [Dehalococcoidales bacterium]|nr:diaminopimelate epimerase [Dehalococcoidales bacterium]